MKKITTFLTAAVMMTATTFPALSQENKHSDHRNSDRHTKKFKDKRTTKHWKYSNRRYSPRYNRRKHYSDRYYKHNRFNRKHYRHNRYRNYRYNHNCRYKNRFYKRDNYRGYRNYNTYYNRRVRRIRRMARQGKISWRVARRRIARLRSRAY